MYHSANLYKTYLTRCRNLQVEPVLSEEYIRTEFLKHLSFHTPYPIETMGAFWESINA